MTTQIDLFDKTYASRKAEGERLRDEGIKKVTDHNENWMFWALDEAELWVEHTLQDDFTGEDIRRWIESEGLKPKHPNAWGALIKTLVKRKIIVPTGEYRQPKDKTSHARAIQVYVEASNLSTVATTTAQPNK